MSLYMEHKYKLCSKCEYECAPRFTADEMQCEWVIVGISRSALVATPKVARIQIVRR